MSKARTLIPSFIVLLILIASISTTIVILSSSIRSLRTDTQTNLESIQSSLSQLQANQASYSSQIKTLTALVVNSLNATDEYINNITQSVTEAKETIHQDVQTVNELADSQNSLLAVQFAGMFTVLVILVSGYHLSQHVRHFHSPVVQRKIMAVLYMTPIYATTSWLSLLFPLSEPYLAVIREFYESYCVYTFLSFLISVLGRGDRYAVVKLLEKEADQLSDPDKYLIPRCFWRCCEKKQHELVPPGSPEASRSGENETVDTTLSDSASSNTTPIRAAHQAQMARHKAEAVLDQCQTYAMQFVLLRPITAIGWLVSNQLIQPKSVIDWRCPQIYIVIVTNVSIFFAFRGLVKFYHATKQYLAWCNPWPKFLCIKGVVFMTFWQKMTLSIIVNIVYIDEFSSNEEATDFVARSQNFLICLEMLFSAVAHCFVFPPEEWAEGYREREERRRERQSQFETHFGDSVALGDFIKDVKGVMESKRRRRLRKRQRGNNKPSNVDKAQEENNNNQHHDNDMGALESTESRGRIDSTESLDDDFDPQFSIADEDEGVLTTAGRNSLTNSSHDRSLSGSERNGSWARIEQFINEHDTGSNSDQFSTKKNDVTTKEIV